MPLPINYVGVLRGWVIDGRVTGAELRRYLRLAAELRAAVVCGILMMVWFLELRVSPEEIEELARQIAARMAPDTLLDARDVAAILKCTPRYVTERFIITPGFPRPLRLTGPNGSRSRPKWQRSEIMAWVDSHKDGRTKRGGRPRKQE